ncbi:MULTISPECIES: hypothetical protein [unclassified Streptomyces]|uniref:hypothetical protein n=1 Tax=unclassified Streptomyces TaxID=2593676 RepID=UPI00332DF0BC
MTDRRDRGTVQSGDGIPQTTLAFPRELGGAGDATDPEQLLASGREACFLGAVRFVAAQRKTKLVRNQTMAPTRRTARAGADGTGGPPGEQGACGLS